MTLFFYFRNTGKKFNLSKNPQKIIRYSAGYPDFQLAGYPDFQLAGYSVLGVLSGRIISDTENDLNVRF